MFDALLLKLRSIINPYAAEEARQKKSRRSVFSSITKRQKFIISVAILSLGLFLSEYFFSGYTFIVALGLAIFTDVFLFMSLYADLKEELMPQAFVLPFLCSLAFGLFYFLTPARLISRVVLTSLYAVAVYSLFLSENIFMVASIRTIALLNSARIVTFVITLISYFFLSNIIFSLRAGFPFTVIIFTIFSLAFVYQALWTYTLEKAWLQNKEWVGVLTLCVVELGSVLWFWPTSPTVLALFLTASMYILTGLTHMWLDKRLFKGVFWEYAWVGVFASIILLWFSHFQG
jgi:hypothetical protein